MQGYIYGLSVAYVIFAALMIMAFPSLLVDSSVNDKKEVNIKASIGAYTVGSLTIVSAIALGIIGQNYYNQS